MADIFNEQRLYPLEEEKILTHFQGYYDGVFIAFLPFFKVRNMESSNTNFKRSQKLTFEEAQVKLDLLKDVPKFNAEIYSYDNQNFPNNNVIYEKGEVVSWKTIVDGSGLNDYTELNRGLKTSIGALRKLFRRPDFELKLNTYTSLHHIWHPSEGTFNFLSKVFIYQTLKLLNKNEVIIADDFCDKTITLSLDNLNEFEFSQAVGFKDYYIYPVDKEILFTIEWDSFFFLIATDKEKLEKVIAQNIFEGFQCNNDTTHIWHYQDGEVQQILKLEAAQRELSHLAARKKWWEFWK